jgi:protein phosphatase 1L
LKEKKRIEEAGGYVSLNGVWRVQGVLATSRAMGDYPLKDKRVVICEPDILSFNLDKNPPDFAVLASDGLWDTHSNEEAVGHIAKCFSNSDSVLGAAKSLTRDAYNKGSTDNVSVMILNLKNMV